MTGSRRALVLRAARFGKNFLSDANFRSVMLLRWRKPTNLFQPFAETADDRYPEIFRFVRQQIGDGPACRILSFGCATGEEVLTLRQYFPLATVKGIDINKRNIAAAQRKVREHGLTGIELETAGAADREPESSYDAIFAMAVFRHGGLGPSGRAGRCDHLIRFVDFEATVNGLAKALRPGGLLFIAHSNFRFGDTLASKFFDVVYRARQHGADPGTPIFDRNNRHLPESDHSDIGFRKKS